MLALRTSVLAALIALLALLPTQTRAHSGLTWGGYLWRVHSGVNGAGQCQSPSHVSVNSLGQLVETISGGCGGGVSMLSNRHLGSWSVTFRMSRGAGKYVVLLWPASGSRPEMDFAEDKPTDALRILTTATYHPKPGCLDCIHATLPGDYTVWHTASVTWTASGFTLSMDGVQWASFKSAYAGQLHLCIQDAAWGSTGTSRLEVARVSVR